MVVILIAKVAIIYEIDNNLSFFFFYRHLIFLFLWFSFYFCISKQVCFSKWTEKMNVAVFCSANNALDPEFFTLTRRLGEWIGRGGHTLVYGGCDMGLMECVAKAVHDSGGRVIGVIPIRLEKGGHVSSYIDVQILCETLGERKQLMLDRSDVVVALPGGIGTLDEIFSVAAEGTLAYHDKRVIVYDMKGFWNGLESLLDGLQQKGVMRGDYHSRITFAHDEDELLRMLA